MRDLTTGSRGVTLAAAFAIGGSLTVLLGVKWLVPLAQAVPAWILLYDALRRGRPARGAALMLLWALVTSLTMIEISIHANAAAERGILRGAAYREEMFHWIRTGEGAESDPVRFIPQHLAHYGLTLGLSFATAGLAGLALGAVLLNYMNYYVGSLVVAAHAPVVASALGWPVWSMLRVTGFVLGAVAAALLLLGPLLRRAPWDARSLRLLATASVAFFLGDLAVKAMLAPAWRLWLLQALGP